MKRTQIIAGLALGVALGGCASSKPLQSCGWIYSVGVTPIGRDIHPLTVDAIDGDNVNARSLRPLPAGRHELKVYE